MFLLPDVIKIWADKLIPPWFSSEKVKPSYGNKDYEAFWNIPEYSGRDEETEESLPRPDGKIIMVKEKKMYLVEITVPWIENREIKYEYKHSKYKEIQVNLRLDYPEYTIDQITLVIDVFGGYSKHLIDNISKIFKSSTEITSIIRNMQKTVIKSEANLSRVFKLRTT